MAGWEWIYVLVAYLGIPTLYVTYRRRRRRRQRAERWEHARRFGSERLSHLAVDTAPFNPQLVPTPERREVIGRRGMTCDQWYETIVADYRARRCDRLPSCADYRQEFGHALARYYFNNH